MPNRGVIPTPEEGRRIERVVRHVERALPIRKARRQKRRRQNGPTNASGQSGFPPGTGGCDCNHCIEGVTMPASSTECCTTHLAWSFVDPVFGGEKQVLWTTGNVWLSDVFTGPDCGGNANEYRWQLTVDVDGETVLELVVETDDGCDVTCARYTVTPWQCQCNNELALAGDWDLGADVLRSDIYCRVCLKPVIPNDSEPCDSFFDGASAPSRFTFFLPPLTTDTCLNGVCEDLANQTVELDLLCPGFSVSGCQPDFTDTWGSGSYMWSANLTSYSDHTCTAGSGIEIRAALYGTAPIALIVCIDSTGGGAAYYEGPTITGAGDYTSVITLTKVSDSTGCTGWPAEINVTPSALTGAVPTASGACTTCTTDTPPVDGDAGACCLGSYCYEYMSSADCTTLDGTWHADLATCENECESLGRCCLYYLSDDSFAGCIDTTEPQCESLWVGGVYSGAWTAGVECASAEPPCEALEIGCCTDDDTLLNCEDKSEAQCLADHPTGWTWTAGGVCDPGTPSCII